MSDSAKKADNSGAKAGLAKISYKKRQKMKYTRVSVAFYYMIIISTIALIIGSIWAILNIFFPDASFEAFLNGNPGSQLLILGMLGLLIFGLIITGWIMFKKGNGVIYRVLYPPIHKEEITKENRYAQIISWGLLVSMFVVVAGGILLAVQYAFGAGSSGDEFLTFFLTMVTGLKIMFISIIVLILTIVVLVFVYIWKNGSIIVQNKILKYNPPEADMVFTKRQNIIASIIFGIFIGLTITLVFGVIWAVMDFAMPTGKLEEFLTLDIPVQILIIGGFLILFFTLLIVGLLFVKRGIDFVKRLLFVKKTLSKEIPANWGAKLLTIGIFAMLALVIVGLVVSLILYLISISSGGGGDVLEWLAALPNGLKITIICSLLMGVEAGIVGGTYMSQNGYYFVLTKIINAQKALSDDMESDDDDTESK
jgi:hypothetical protein